MKGGKINSEGEEKTENVNVKYRLHHDFKPRRLATTAYVSNPSAVRVVMVGDMAAQGFLCNIFTVRARSWVCFDPAHPCELLFNASSVGSRLEHGRARCKLWSLDSGEIVACRARVLCFRRRCMLQCVVLPIVWGGVAHVLWGVGRPSFRQRN